MNNLFKKYSEIRNAIRHIIANDQTLMKLLYYNVDDPLSKEDISIGHIENTHFFMDARAYNNLDDNGETIVDKEKVVLMFNWEVNDIRKCALGIYSDNTIEDMIEYTLTFELPEVKKVVNII